MIERFRRLFDRLILGAPPERKSAQTGGEDTSEPPPPKPKAPGYSALRRASLLFVGGGLDERKTSLFRLSCPYRVVDSDRLNYIVPMPSQYPITVEYEVDGRRFAVRKMDGHLIYRERDGWAAEDAFALLDTQLGDFVEAYRRGNPGRCVLHRPRCMGTDEAVYLFFRADGGGMSLLPHMARDRGETSYVVRYERVDFAWDDLPDAVEDIISAPVDALRDLCEEVFEFRVNPMLREPFIYRIPPREMQIAMPMAWIDGSEEDLRRLTRAICQTEPGLFDRPFSVTVVYRGTTPEKRGGYRCVLCALRSENRYTSRRMVSLCDLAYRLNAFGLPEKEVPPGPHYLIERRVARLEIEVNPPSPDETADASRVLADWLDGTLHRADKRARFSLPPRYGEPDGSAARGDVV